MSETDSKLYLREVEYTKVKEYSKKLENQFQLLKKVVNSVCLLKNNQNVKKGVAQCKMANMKKCVKYKIQVVAKKWLGW